MRALILALALLSTIALTGCVGSVQRFETKPVTVMSSQGPVLCQLYSSDMTLWDRSIDRPAAMDIATANRLCREEGLRTARYQAP